MKLIHNELPTLDNLIKRNETSYNKHRKCVLCKTNDETLDHLLTCEKTKANKEKIWMILQEKIVKTWIPKLSPIKSPNTQRIILLLNRWKERKSESAKEIINLCIGLWKKEDIAEWETSLRMTQVSKTQARNLLSRMSKTWCKLLRQHIWNPRCDEVQK